MGGGCVFDPSNLAVPAMRIRDLICVWFVSPMAIGAAADPTPLWRADDALQFVRQYCVECHDGSEGEAGLDLSAFDGSERIAADTDGWNTLLRRVRDHEMPPRDSVVPALQEREAFVAWVRSTLQQAACAGGIVPGPPQMRRLNRSEYAATLRDLLGIHVDAGQGLPDDGAGGEGFDNARETLFISPIHAEKYLEAARRAIDYAWREPQARQRIVTAEPDDATTPEQAAQRVLQHFLPRAFRRPATADELEQYAAVFRSALEAEGSYDAALQNTLEAAIVSPKFLFLLEQPHQDAAPALLSNHELACRLSYFLWNSMPDEQLTRLADAEQLNDSQILQQQVLRMLGADGADGQDRGRRVDEHTRDFAQSFVEQWLGTRALGREFKPDPSLGVVFDSELEGGLRYEPILFFQEIVTENLSLLNLLDSNFTYLNSRLARHYEIAGDFREQPSRAELPADSHRGGLLGMGAVLAVSSYPHRTSPVLRGKWLLETLWGTPPPPPPPNVPALVESTAAGETPRTLRARLEQHRQDPKCASCHDRIDPLGFGLENYDVLGRWRTEDSGQPIDSRGQLPDGATFAGPAELKQVALSRKDDFVRHLTAKMLGYALGRSLTHEDACAVDQIVEQVQQQDYRSHALIMGIVESIPFRYKAGSHDAPVSAQPASSSQGTAS